MSEDVNTTEDAAEGSDFDKLQALVDQVKVDGPKGLEGNKQAARRARGARGRDRARGTCCARLALPRSGRL